MKTKFLFFLPVILFFSFSGCKKNPDTTMVFHVTNSTANGYVIQMNSSYKSETESTYASTYDHSITLPGENRVVASSWACIVTNADHQPSHITITMTFNGGTPHTCSDTTGYGLQCQGQ